VPEIDDDSLYDGGAYGGEEEEEEAYEEDARRGGGGYGGRGGRPPWPGREVRGLDRLIASEAAALRRDEERRGPRSGLRWDGRPRTVHVRDGSVSRRRPASDRSPFLAELVDLDARARGVVREANRVAGLPDDGYGDAYGEEEEPYAEDDGYDEEERFAEEEEAEQEAARIRAPARRQQRQQQQRQQQQRPAAPRGPRVEAPRPVIVVAGGRVQADGRSPAPRAAYDLSRTAAAADPSPRRSRMSDFLKGRSSTPSRARRPMP